MAGTFPPLSLTDPPSSPLQDSQNLHRSSPTRMDEAFFSAASLVDNDSSLWLGKSQDVFGDLSCDDVSDQAEDGEAGIPEANGRQEKGVQYQGNWHSNFTNANLLPFSAPSLAGETPLLDIQSKDSFDLLLEQIRVGKRLDLLMAWSEYDPNSPHFSFPMAPTTVFNLDVPDVVVSPAPAALADATLVNSPSGHEMQQPAHSTDQDASQSSLAPGHLPSVVASNASTHQTTAVQADANQHQDGCDTQMVVYTRTTDPAGKTTVSGVRSRFSSAADVNDWARARQSGVALGATKFFRFTFLDDEDQRSRHSDGSDSDPGHPTATSSTITSGEPKDALPEANLRQGGTPPTVESGPSRDEVPSTVGSKIQRRNASKEDVLSTKTSSTKIDRADGAVGQWRNRPLHPVLPSADESICCFCEHDIFYGSDSQYERARRRWRRRHQKQKQAEDAVSKRQTKWSQSGSSRPSSRKVLPSQRGARDCVAASSKAADDTVTSARVAATCDPGTSSPAAAVAMTTSNTLDFDARLQLFARQLTRITGAIQFSSSPNSAEKPIELTSDVCAAALAEAEDLCKEPYDKTDSREAGFEGSVQMPTNANEMDLRILNAACRLALETFEPDSGHESLQAEVREWVEGGCIKKAPVDFLRRLEQFGTVKSGYFTQASSDGRLPWPAILGQPGFASPTLEKPINAEWLESFALCTCQVTKLAIKGTRYLGRRSATSPPPGEGSSKVLSATSRPSNESQESGNDPETGTAHSERANAQESDKSDSGETLEIKNVTRPSARSGRGEAAAQALRVVLDRDKQRVQAACQDGPVLQCPQPVRPIARSPMIADGQPQRKGLASANPLSSVTVMSVMSSMDSEPQLQELFESLSVDQVSTKEASRQSLDATSSSAATPPSAQGCQQFSRFIAHEGSHSGPNPVEDTGPSVFNAWVPEVELSAEDMQILHTQGQEMIENQALLRLERNELVHRRLSSLDAGAATDFSERPGPSRLPYPADLATSEPSASTDTCEVNSTYTDTAISSAPPDGTADALDALPGAIPPLGSTERADPLSTPETRRGIARPRWRLTGRAAPQPRRITISQPPDRVVTLSPAGLDGFQGEVGRWSDEEGESDHGVQETDIPAENESGAMEERAQDAGNIPRVLADFDRFEDDSPSAHAQMDSEASEAASQARLSEREQEAETAAQALA